MEAKQFPEKWAVRGSQEFAEFLKRCDKIKAGIWNGRCDTYVYYLRDGKMLEYDNIPNGYTEVTLEDLIAHYEPKKMVRCVNKRFMKDTGKLTIGKEYEVLEENESQGFLVVSDNSFQDYFPTCFFRVIESKKNTTETTEPTHPKWMPLTQGKEKVKEIVQIDKYFVYTLEKGGFPITCTSEGIAIYVNSCFNLIPYNPRIAELEEKITSKRSELAELEGELNTLKGN